jgi:hypothetical protein
VEVVAACGGGKAMPGGVWAAVDGGAQDVVDGCGGRGKEVVCIDTCVYN